MTQIQRVLATLFVLVTTMVSAQEPSVTLKGKVYDTETQKGIYQASIRLFDEQGGMLKTITTDQQGDYQLNFQQEVSRFRVVAEATEYNQAEVLITNSEKGAAVDFGLNCQEKPVVKANLPKVYFDFDSSYLTAIAKEDLKGVIHFMKNNPSVVLRVNAHTDTRGSNDYNHWLSKRRAERVRDWLIQKGGIEASRIEEHHFGKTQLSNHCNDGVSCTAQQHRENRRCSFEIVVEK